VIAQETTSDNSVFPQSELPTARQYRHCGLLRHVGDDIEFGQYRSIPARTAHRHQIIDLKSSFADRYAATLDLGATPNSDGSRSKQPLGNFHRRVNATFKKRNPGTGIGTAVPNPAVGLCMKLAK